MLLVILVLRQKNAHIMLDSQNNATLVPENASFRFKQNVQTGLSISTFPTFLPVLMLLERNMDFQNTFLGGKDFSTSTGKKLPSLTIKLSPGNSLTHSCNGR